MNRRQFLMASGTLGLSAWPLSLEEGLWNPCLDGLPRALANHDIVRAAWDGIDPAAFWDCHVHLIGVGDSNGGLWITPAMQSLWHPVQYLQRVFYQNASCAERQDHVDEDFRARLLRLQAELPAGNKVMLLAFAHHHDETGVVDLASSAYYSSNAAARDLARRYPAQFEWIASIHPYQPDCVTQLEAVVRDGARAVKWLPSAMGIDPAAPRCDPFYAALARLDVPLLSHGGKELAVHGGAHDEFNNPLRLRRALGHGVRVIVAHCASLGSYPDIDRGRDASPVEAFTLFARLMDEARYENLLYGDLSAVTQVNRLGPALNTVLERDDWHARLVNGSDYPLPGVVPLFALSRMVGQGLITTEQAALCSEIRRYNPLLFDFVLKRCLRSRGKGLAPGVFESRRVFGAGEPSRRQSGA
jgi:predicted TIM-barrel fold metal-dependent hydrolase